MAGDDEGTAGPGSVLPMKRKAEGAPQEGEEAAGVRPKDESLTLSFEEQETKGIKLLEIGSDEMLRCLQEGGAVIKASEPDEKVVLCTVDKTFAVRVVETSNSVFLVEDGDSKCFKPAEGRAEGDAVGSPGGTPGPMTQMASASARSSPPGGLKVCTIVSENWEIEEIAPDFKMLDELLGAGDDGDLGGSGQAGGEDPIVGHTLEELVDMVQGSESEILEELQRRGDAMQVGDRWVRVTEASASALIDVLVSKVSENGWGWGELPLERVLACMEEEEFRRETTLHVIRVLGTAPMFLGSVTEGTVGSIVEKKLCVHYARKLLRKKAYSKLEPFMEEWSNTVPVGMEVSAEMLEGLALQDDSGAVVFFDKLPRDPKGRFDLLFRVRPRWKAAELRAWLEGLTISPGKQVDDVLEDHLHSYHPQGSADNPLMYVRKII